MKTKYVLIPASVLLIMACSNRQIYDTIQRNNEIECSKLPQDQYEQCMSEIDQPYKEYEREVQEIKEK